MQCHLNGVQISEAPKFLADNPGESTHAIQQVHPLDAVHLLIIPLQLQGATSF